MRYQTPPAFNSSLAPRKDQNLFAETFTVDGGDSDEDDEDMEEIHIGVIEKTVTAGDDMNTAPTDPPFGEDDVDAEEDILSGANIDGNNIQRQNQLAEGVEKQDLINYSVNETVTLGHNTSTGLERNEIDANADLAFILDTGKVAGNNDVQLQDKPREVTVDPVVPLSNSTNTEPLNRSQTLETGTTEGAEENAAPVQPPASQNSAVAVDEDKVRYLSKRERRKARNEAKELNPPPSPKPVPAHLTSDSVQVTQHEQWAVKPLPAWYIPGPQPDPKGKGKAKAPAEPSASGRRKRANSTEIQPDVGGSKKRRVAPHKAGVLPMPVMAVESSASAQVYTYTSHVADPVGLAIPQATSSDQYDQPFAYMQARGPVMHQASTSRSTEGFGSQFVSLDPSAEPFAYGQAPGPIMPQAPTYGSEDGMSSLFDSSDPYVQPNTYNQAMIPQASIYGSGNPYDQSFGAGTYTYTQATGPIMPQASTSASGSTRPRAPLFTAPTPQASTVMPSNRPSITRFEPQNIIFLSKLIAGFPNLDVSLFYANQAIPDLETARICPLCPVVVKLRDFEAHVEACHSTYKCTKHKDAKAGVAGVTKDLLERHLNEYNLYCPHCNARTQPPLNRMREHFMRCTPLKQMQAQKKAEKEAEDEAKRQAALRNAY